MPEVVQHIYLPNTPLDLCPPDPEFFKFRSEQGRTSNGQRYGAYSRKCLVDYFIRPRFNRFSPTTKQ